jgi:ankyrin repeat protein
MLNLSLAIHQSRSSNVGGVHLASTAQNPVTLFLEDLRSSMSERNKNQDRWPIYMKDVLSSLETLLPDGKLQPVYDSRQSLITEDEIFGTKFNQLLVFSIANNFAGLPDIPVESMLKYWSRGGGMVSLLLQSLQASQSHFAKALAQNLFPAAIEANDERALKHLLSIGSIDVNTTMCIVNGEKYTPVERAAYLQELGIVELLLIAKADVNKTFQEIVKEFYLPRSNLRGALGSFVEGCRTTTSEAFELGKLLLRAGAKVHAEVAKHALEYLCHRDLTYLIVSSISDSDHAECIESQLLTCIAANLSDRQATEVTNKLISACQRTNCGRCLSQFKDYVDSALVQGTRCGHSQLVGLLLRYSTTPHRALSAAIKCGKHELIDTILTLKPDMDAPAHSIREWSSIFGQGRDRKNDDEDDVTTSLAEAIKARDESLILMIEDASSLAHLDEGGRFEPAITAASKTGNTIYVQKLLKHCPSPKPSYMTNAVLHAIQNSDEQIFRILLAAGANVNERDGFGRAGPTLLLAAMVCRNSYMVREILNADIMASDSIESIFKEAIKWGDKSIIEDIRSTFPGIQLEGNELSKALEQGHMEWFELLVSSRMVSGYALTNCLKVALERGDDRLFHDLIKRGANPTGSSILDHCAEKCPKRLPLLLERFPFRASNYIVPGFGTSALIAVIKQGLDGLEAVNILLGCGLIDTESFSFRNDLPLGEAIRVSRNGNHADYAVIRKLLDSGCDPNCFVVRTRNYGPVSNQTAFLEAVGTKSKSLVQLMIDRGADVKRQATMGLKRTPLQRAVEVNSLELVTLLLGAKADPNDKPATRGGGTALQLAAIQGNCNIAAKLLEWGADLSAPPAVVNGRWPLEGAAEHGRLDMIEFLWKNKLAGCDVAGFDEKQCRRAMELAEENGHDACRDLIAELSQASASASVPAVE